MARRFPVGFLHPEGGIMSLAMTVVLLMQFAFPMTLSVRITAAGTREPLPIAYVRVQRFGVMVQEAVAPDGRVEIPDLTAGRYTITVEAAGYDTAYAEVNLPVDSLSTIELRPRNRPQPNPSHSTSAGEGIRRLFHKLFR
jgi:Carboxypeptidase regulatory-like domain